jgi:hypothetical protein
MLAPRVLALYSRLFVTTRSQVDRIGFGHLPAALDGQYVGYALRPRPHLNGFDTKRLSIARNR